MTYVDAEVFSQKPPDGLEGGGTRRKQHQLASLAYSTVGAHGFQDRLSERHKMWMDHCEAHDKPNDLAERFFSSLLDLFAEYQDWKQTVNNAAALPGTESQKQAFAAAEHCQLCRARFQHVGKRTKCWHHRHGTGECLGALCSSCNGAVQQPRHLTFVLQNGGGYDFHFLLGALSRDWSKMSLTVLQKSGEKNLQFQFGPLRFIDSSNTYKESLGSLIDELKQGHGEHLERAFPLIAARHPELQKAKLTDERRRRLHSLFGDVDTDWDQWDDEQYQTWTWNLLLRKLPMPFDELSSPEDWERPAVWEQHEYDSELAGRRCDDETYRSIRETAWAMEWTSFRQYHDCYTSTWTWRWRTSWRPSAASSSTALAWTRCSTSPCLARRGTP